MVSRLGMEALLGLALELGEEVLPFKEVLAAVDEMHKGDLAGQCSYFIPGFRVKPGRY